MPVRAAAARLIPARRSAPTSAAKAARNATVHVRRAIPHRQHPNVMTPRRTNVATPVTGPRTVIRARDIMTAAAAGSIVKEAFVRRTVHVAAPTAKATTFRIPAAVITVPVTAITVTDIVRLNVSTLVLRHPTAEILTMKHPTFRLITIPAVPVFVTTTVIV